LTTAITARKLLKYSIGPNIAKVLLRPREVKGNTALAMLHGTHIMSAVVCISLDFPSLGGYAAPSSKPLYPTITIKF
tara:strand:- start:82 stop:312 length:231 start_codon:yes stop_codon:yes gene_type:complete